MNDETITALKNYDWLMRNREDVAIDWRTQTLVYGDGGVVLEALTEKGFTPGSYET